MARILRLVVYALIGILAISFIRGMMNIISGAFAQAMRGGSVAKSAATPTEPEGPLSGDLVKDPVCGTYVSVMSPHSKSAGGKTHYFCSQACLDRFAA